MDIIQIADTIVKVIKPQKWDEGLATFGLFNMLFMPHFGHSAQDNMYVKQFLVYVHRGYLWLDRPYPITVELIARIIGLPSEGKDLLPYLTKHKTQAVNIKHNLQCAGRGYLIGPI